MYLFLASPAAHSFTLARADLGGFGVDPLSSEGAEAFDKFVKLPADVAEPELVR